MPHTADRPAVFLLRWTIVGLACAGVLLLIRPGLLGNADDRGAEQRRRAAGRRRRAATLVRGRRATRRPRSRQHLHGARGRRIRRAPLGGNPLLRQHLPAVRQRVEGSLGSGVIVDAAGHVVTNHHVVQGADEIRVQLADGRIATPEIVGMDRDTDLAVLRVPLRTCRSCRWAARTSCAPATSCSRSAIRSGSARR